MKKLIFCASAALVMLASCGKSEVCDCVDTIVEVRKEFNAAKGDKTKEKAIEVKFKTQDEKCKKVFDKKTEEEFKKLEAEVKKCDGYPEMEKMMKEGK